jgi:hypothetical protein
MEVESAIGGQALMALTYQQEALKPGLISCHTRHGLLRVARNLLLIHQKVQ